MRIRLDLYANAHKHCDMPDVELTKAAVDLKTWMEAHNVSQGELARRVTEELAAVAGRSEKAVNQSTISNWCRGAYTPSGQAMVALQKVTSGFVTVTDWIVPASASSSSAITLPTGT